MLSGPAAEFCVKRWATHYLRARSTGHVEVRLGSAGRKQERHGETSAPAARAGMGTAALLLGAHGAPSEVTTIFRPPRLLSVSGMAVKARHHPPTDLGVRS